MYTVKIFRREITLKRQRAMCTTTRMHQDTQAPKCQRTTTKKAEIHHQNSEAEQKHGNKIDTSLHEQDTTDGDTTET